MANSVALCITAARRFSSQAFHRTDSVPLRSSELWVAIASVLAIYASAIYYPVLLVAVLVVVVIACRLVSGSCCFLLLFPCIAPFQNVELPGLPSMSLLRFFLVAVVFSLLLDMNLLNKLMRRIPGYALLGITWLLTIELISAAFLSPAPTAWTDLAARFTRALEFLIAAALARQKGGLPRVAAGCVIYGILQVLAAGIIHFDYGGAVLAARSFLGFELGSLDAVSLLVVSIGYIAVASFWSGAALSMHRSRVMQFVLWSTGSLAMVAAFYSGRRQALLALGLCLLVAGLVIKGSHKSLIIGVVAVLACGFYLAGPGRDFLEQRDSLLVEFSADGRKQYVPIHRAGLRAFLDSPVWGIGLANYPSASAAMGLPGPSGKGEAAHSSTIRILAEEGLIGTIGFAILTFGYALSIGRTVFLLRSSKKLTPMHFFFPAIGVVLTGYTVTILDGHDYVYLFGATIGLMCQYIKGNSTCREAKQARRFRLVVMRGSASPAVAIWQIRASKKTGA